jgi:hypothetical protein
MHKKTPQFFEEFFVGLLGQNPYYLNEPQETSTTLINIGFLNLYCFTTPQKTLENFIL